MKHWEVEYKGQQLRIEWNEHATFNLQAPVDGEWVDYHWFACGDIGCSFESEQEAFDYAMKELEDLER